MITIVHLIGSLEIGGAEMMLWKLLSRMNKQRFCNIVICWRAEGPLADELRAIGIPVHDLGMQHDRPVPLGNRRIARLLKASGAVIRLVRLLRRIKPDIVQTWLYHADLLGLLAAKLARVPVIAWNILSSDFDLSPYPRHHFWARQMCAKLSGKPRAVVVLSEEARDSHVQIGYGPREWVVIPIGVDTQQFLPDPFARTTLAHELGIGLDVPLIGLVGRFDPIKGHRTFIQAAGLLGQQQPEAHFILVGRDITADNMALRTSAEASGVGDRIHLLGMRPDLPRLTAAMDIANSSSYSEGFGTVIIEAMACCVPCVVTNVGASARIVGDTGRVVPPRDATALAAAWQELLDLGPAGRELLGLRARARVETHYGLDSVVRQYETLYERLAKTEWKDAFRLWNLP